MKNTVRNIFANTFLALVVFGLYQACTPPAGAQSADLTLSWSDNSDNEEGFLLQYKAPGSDTWVLSEYDITANQTSLQIQVPLVGGETHTWRIAAYNRWYDNYRVSGWSNEASITFDPEPATPNAPSQATVVIVNITNP